MKVHRYKTGTTALYVEGDGVRPEMRGGFMDEATYTAVVDNTIIVCTDAVIINRRRCTFLLAKRAVRPMKGLWWIGGRRQKGELPIEAMCRNFRRETGLDLPRDRFSFVTVTEYLWQDREQVPQEKGSHNIAHQFMVELTGDEFIIAQGHLDKKEYEIGHGLKEFDWDQLVDAEVHPMILDLYDMIFST